MSIEAVNWALNEASVEDASDAAVLVGLANHADPEDWTAFPSVGRLAYYSRLSERTVRRALRSLEIAGLIVETEDTRVRDAKMRADQRPTVYRLVHTKKRESYEERRRAQTRGPKGNGGSECPPVTGGQSDRPDTVTGRTDTTARGVTVTPEPSVEPSGTLSPSEREHAREDTDAQLAIIPAEGDAEPEPPAKRKRKVGVPDDWQPSEALCEWTSKTAPGMPRSEVAAFVAYHQAHGNTFMRLDRAWQTWVNRWVERRASRGAGRPGPYRNTGWDTGTSEASWDRFMQEGPGGTDE